LIELAKSLKSIGSQLKVIAGRPEDIIPSLVGEEGVLAYQQEDTYEEQCVEKRVLERIHLSTVVVHHRHQTLLNRNDLGWDPQNFLPMPFGKYWHGACQSVQPRPQLPNVKEGDLPAPLGDIGNTSFKEVSLDIKELAELLGFDADENLVVGASREFVWRGGEAAAQAQMAAYAGAQDGLGTHMQTRNRFHGASSFSRLSPWMALGVLSPRTVYWWVFDYFKGAGKQVVKDPRFDHFHKYVFQLCWRDFFRFYCAHFGSKVFFLEGPALRKRSWKRDADAERRWKAGQTGVPIVDALMRELRATGFMSNRGRYLVASYLVFYLGIDWRLGADWFEHCLIDHDVCSNWGEWASMANVAVDLGERYPMGLKGRGPSDGRDKGRKGGGGDPWAKGAHTGDAVFDPWEQAVQYDRSEEFVRRWVPEVADLPIGQAHNPPDLGAAYPRPLAVHALTLPKSPAEGCRDGPYGPYYGTDRAGSHQTKSTIKKATADTNKEMIANTLYEPKQRATQSLYHSQSYARKAVRRWAPKPPPAA
jgi:deoxyribodipyrimidine photo-lyase